MEYFSPSIAEIDEFAISLISDGKAKSQMQVLA
jgi:hypothetical protein